MATLQLQERHTLSVRDHICRYLDNCPHIWQRGHMDQGSMTRYFSEMIWFPTAFLEPNVSFTPIDDQAVRATFSDHGRSVSATLCFDDEGRFTDFVAERYRMAGDRYELTPWSTPMSEYGEFEGLKLPVKGRAVWKLPEGDLEYIDVAITELDYNVAGRTDREPSREHEARTRAETTV